MHSPGAGAPPLITAIITSYNYAHYLDASIGSVLKQDFPSFELIVVDNASTDDTDAVVARWSHDARLRYYKNETNIGLTPNHNRGLSYARGSYILFLSADDMLLPGHFRRCYDYLQAHPAIDVLYTGALFMNADGDFTGVRAMGGQLPCDYDGGRNEFAQQLSEGCYVPWPSMVIPRRLYDELGPMADDFIGSDYEITVRWAAAGKRFAYLRAPSCAIRLHGPQASGTSYVTSGRDVAEYLTMLETYVVPKNERRLRGYQAAIAGHLRWRAGFFGETSGKPLEPDLAARVEAMTKTIEAIPDGKPGDDLGDDPLVTVVVRVGTLFELAATLASLRDQIDAPPFEAIVVGEGGPDLRAAIDVLPLAGRTRYVRLDEPNPGLARNVGIRLAAGRIITYLDPGSIFEPQHLANLAAAFDAGVTAARAGGRLFLADSRDGTRNTIFRQTSIAGLYRGNEDPDRDFIAPSVPVEAIAHLRSVVQHIGLFRTDLAWGEVWEFWLRLRRFPHATLGGDGVRVALLRQTAIPDAAAFHTIVGHIYGSYVAPPDSAPTRRRNAYVAEMTRWFERRADLLADDQTMFNFLADLHGIERSIAAPT